MNLHVRCVCLASLYWVQTACLRVPSLYWVLTTCRRRGRSWGSWWLARQWREGVGRAAEVHRPLNQGDFFAFTPVLADFGAFFFRGQIQTRREAGDR